jgi:hypothetical protein
MHNIQLNCLFAKEKSAALIFLTLEAAFVKDFRMKAVIIYLCLFSVLQAFDLNAFTQIPVNESSDSISNSLRRENEFFKTQLDLIDLGMKIIGKDPARRFGEMDRKNMKLHLLFTPSPRDSSADCWEMGLFIQVAIVKPIPHPFKLQ